MLENGRSEASRRRKSSRLLAPKPPGVEKCSKTLAPKPPDVEKSPKMLAGAERIIEKDFEIEFEKEFRNPAVEDTSLNDASLNEASLRAFNARAHTSIYINICEGYDPGL